MRHVALWRAKQKKATQAHVPKWTVLTFWAGEAAAEREADMEVGGGQTLRKTQGASEDTDGERKEQKAKAH